MHTHLVLTSPCNDFDLMNAVPQSNEALVLTFADLPRSSLLTPRVLLNEAIYAKILFGLFLSNCRLRTDISIKTRRWISSIGAVRLAEARQAEPRAEQAKDYVLLRCRGDHDHARRRRRPLPPPPSELRNRRASVSQASQSRQETHSVTLPFSAPFFDPSTRNQLRFEMLCYP